MALTKVGKEGITGISNSSDATAITIDSSENVTANANLTVTGNSTLNGKLNNCWKRMQTEWTTKLMNDDSFTDAIPSNQADFVALVTARSDYQTRKQRDDASKIGQE